MNSTESQEIQTSSSSHHNHTASKQLHEAAPSDSDLTEIDQWVKPSKVHVQPLHADDLLYESTKFEPGAGQCKFVKIRNATLCQTGRHTFVIINDANKKISSEKKIFHNFRIKM